MRRGLTGHYEITEVGGETKHLEKLQAFTGDSAYQYRLGLFLRIGPMNDLELRVFIHGKEAHNWTEDLRQALGAMGYG